MSATASASSSWGGVGRMLEGATATRSAYPPMKLKAITRSPGLMPEPSGAERTTPAVSIPGTKGGSIFS
ncbi:Uncharacterised protein [Mycobacteroides abscessus subsp. abscessus]|nr:Uncharacterised protein [Mycobacteroides abscessus subsp. abscessus]